MIFRTIAGLAALYVWGNPVLDSFRPHELDAPSSAVRQIFKPAVTQASDYLGQYIPPEVKYAQASHPLLVLDRKFGAAADRRTD